MNNSAGCVFTRHLSTAPRQVGRRPIATALTNTGRSLSTQIGDFSKPARRHFWNRKLDAQDAAMRDSIDVQAKSFDALLKADCWASAAKSSN